MPTKATFNDYLAAREKSGQLKRAYKRINGTPAVWAAFDAYAAARDEAWRVYKEFSAAHDASVRLARRATQERTTP